MSRIGKLIETGRRLAVARSWRKGGKEAHGVSFWDDDNKVAIVSGGGCMTL